MRILFITLIDWYQRFISPHKGFRCAHHQLHRGDTCSNAVKGLIAERGVRLAWPAIRERFAQCREASITLSRLTPKERMDLGCDIACDPGLSDCGGGGGSKTTVCVGPCDFFGSSERLTRRQRTLVIVLVTTVTLVFGYWFYGRAVSEVIVEQIGAEQSLLSKFTRREEPKLRVMLLSEGEKYYSETVELNAEAGVARLSFKNGPLSYQLDTLEIHDARLSVGGEMLVVGQVLEEFNSPAVSGRGNRFRYQLKRRWHFWE